MINFRNKAKEALLARVAEMPYPALVLGVEKELKACYGQAHLDINEVFEKILKELQDRKAESKTKNDFKSYETFVCIEAWIKTIQNDIAQVRAKNYGN